MTKTPATERQIKFLNTLAAERKVPASWSELPDMIRNGLDSREASLLIQKALDYPKVEAEYSVAAANFSQPALLEAARAQDALRSIPKSKYAIPFAELELYVPNIQSYGNDLLFFEVKEFRKHLYMNRLRGSVGGFRRTRLRYADIISLANLIKEDPTAAAVRFGQHFGVCGRCAAQLTDAESRARFMGPVCARVMGLHI